MKTLKFNHELVELINSGTMIATWRLLDDKYLSEGDEISFIDASTGEHFSTGLAEKVIEKRFIDLTEQDRAGHKTYASDDEMYEAFSKNYGGIPVNKNTSVKIIKFSLIAPLK